ncbi:uncharacterized protein N7529_002106, partial [Penicillium soppii]|uniref:uncharacterized protein n=1 Tax=Penicillium soppii TaxID=69789 RepID=UPI00254929EB
CRESQDLEDGLKLQNPPQQSSNATAIEPDVVTPTSLAADFMKLLHYNDTLATPALKLLDLYFCLWKFHVVKSAEKIRLGEEYNIVLQLCNEQTLAPLDTKWAIEAFCNRVILALQTVTRIWTFTPSGMSSLEYRHHLHVSPPTPNILGRFPQVRLSLQDMRLHGLP